MAETDAEQEARQARRARIRRIKLLIFIVPLFSIMILLGLCIFLGIRLHMVKKELRDMRAAIEATTVINQTDLADDTNEAENEPALYTVSEVEEFTQTGIDENDASEEEADVRKVYLTFDDGPSSNTNRILDILAEYDVKATFFVVGKEEEEYQALYKRIVDEGHTLAMHSYSHKYNEIYQSVESFSADLSKLQEFLYDTTGVWCRYCRFPGGSSNTVSRVDMHELIDYLDDQDMSYFDWNISSGDAASSYIGPADIIRNCTVKLRDYDEAIILMHDASNKNSTVEALPGLIETIQAMEDTKILPITDDTERIHHISND
ncbi:MAG: polysaccharide deacetylase [Lachnospiraceae bacterium]|nr:polysaccharide deacetylase [Lachnospiraceae bacterium]